MSGATALELLRSRMARSLDLGRALSVEPLANSRRMSEVLRTLQRELGEEGSARPSEDLVKTALITFARTGEVVNPQRLKYLCYGLAVPIGSAGARIIDNAPLFERLLGQVTQQAQRARHFRRAYQGLLAGYLSLDLASLGVESVQTNWRRLQKFLADKLDAVITGSTRPGRTLPSWLTVLDQHRNLLGDDPCARYAQGLMRHDTSELQALSAGLGLVTTSWVWERSLMDYVRLVCAAADPAFLRGLPDLLDLANGHRDLSLPGLLSQEVVAMSVRRYAECTDKPEHTALRDACLSRFGNPWLRRTAWDAQVKSEAARTMVESWIKRRLIRDFFELLAEDGAADLRRLNYWLKWEPYIDDMWFILGTDAQANRSAAFLELRKRMAGRDRNLIDSNPRNNAFVMRMGSLIVLEFGVTGNAARLFAATDFQADLDQKWHQLNALKQKEGATRLDHRWDWESRFDDALKAHLGGVRPSARPTAPAPDTRRGTGTSPMRPPVSRRRPLTPEDVRSLMNMCTWYALTWENNLDKGGAFWILLPDRSKKLALSNMLERRGFTFAAGKGFWIKEMD